jgi:hypothetical protein
MPTSSTELQHIQGSWCQLTSEISFVPATPRAVGPSLPSPVRFVSPPPVEQKDVNTDYLR